MIDVVDDEAEEEDGDDAGCHANGDEVGEDDDGENDDDDEVVMRAQTPARRELEERNPSTHSLPAAWGGANEAW